MSSDNLLELAAAKLKVESTGKGLSKRALAKLFAVSVKTAERDVGGGRLTRQIAGANRYPARVRQAVNGALRTLARIEALTYFTDEQLAEYFASLNVKADRLRFLGDLLEGIGESMQKQEAKSEARKCVECGDSLDLLDGEARARHCSPKCRQAAYRKRVTARASSRTEKASQTRLSDGAPVAGSGLAVTQRLDADG
jgi:transposase